MPTCSLGESLSFIFSARVELLRHRVCRNLRHPAKNSHRLASSAGRDEVYAALFTMSPGIPGARHSPVRSIRVTKHPRTSTIYVTNEFARPPLCFWTRFGWQPATLVGKQPICRRSLNDKHQASRSEH